MTTNAERIAPAAAAVAAPPEKEAFPLARLIVVVVGMFMITLDFFVVNVAIPGVRTQFGATTSQIEFIVAGFSLAYAASMITAGRLGDLFGRRKLLSYGMVLFTVASLLCGIAPNPGVLVAARILQGVGAAIMSPQMLAILNTQFKLEHRIKAFTAFALAVGLGATFGQLIGGALVDWNIFDLGWRTIFLINVPIGVVVLLMVPRVIAEARGTGKTGLDLPGTALATASMVAIVLPLIEGREQGWPVWCWICLIAALPLLALFVAHQRRTERRGHAPLISMSLFHDRAFSVGIVAILGFFSTMASFFLVLALFLQQGRGMSPLAAGLVFGVIGIGYIGSTLAAPAVAAKLGKQVLTVGALVTAIGFAIEIATVAEIGVGGSVGWMTIGFLVSGVGMGLFMNPVTPTVMAGVNPAHAAAAGGVLATAQEGGNAFGVAIIGVIFFSLVANAAPAAFAGAFIWSLAALAAILVAVAGVVQLLPSPAAQN